MQPAKITRRDLLLAGAAGVALPAVVAGPAFASAPKLLIGPKQWYLDIDLPTPLWIGMQFIELLIENLPPGIVYGNDATKFEPEIYPSSVYLDHYTVNFRHQVEAPREDICQMQLAPTAWAWARSITSGGLDFGVLLTMRLNKWPGGEAYGIQTVHDIVVYRSVVMRTSHSVNERRPGEVEVTIDMLAGFRSKELHSPAKVFQGVDIQETHWI